MGVFINFKESYPHLLKYWDYKQNAKKPEEVHPGSKTAVHFICERGHSFQKEPRYFKRSVSKKLNCPLCKSTSNKKLLFKEKPKLLKYWDYEKNTIDPSVITIGSRASAYFICEKGHSFKRSVSGLSIVNSITCKFCSGQQVNKNNQLDLNYPDLLTEWDYEKNTITP